MEDELLTVAEVAEILRLNQQTIRNWIDAGSLPYVHLGRRVRIWRSDYQALIGESAGGHRSRTPPIRTIWDGVVPPPEVPPSQRTP